MMTGQMTTSTRIPFRLPLLLLIAALFLPPTSRAAEPSIGRLFSSPRERATLDLARQKMSRNRIEANMPIEDPFGDQVTLDGFVRKNNGKTTVWINQLPQHSSDNRQGITIMQSGRNAPVVTMRLPSGKSVNLKAGQTFDAANGKVNDLVDGQAKPDTK